MTGGKKYAFSGYLSKRSVQRKKWRRRFFVISDGLVKYYTSNSSSDPACGDGLKGVYDLTGARVDKKPIEHPHRLSITIPQDRRNEIVLEAETEEEFKRCFDALNSGITQKNISALAGRSRLPEIVDWYYQRQALFYTNLKVLERETRFLLQLALPGGGMGLSPGGGGATIQSHSTLVKVMVNKDQSGLLFRVDGSGRGKSGRGMSRLESMTDGRVVLFRDIEGVRRQHGAREVGMPVGGGRERGVSSASSGDDEGTADDDQPVSVVSSASTVPAGSPMTITQSAVSHRGREIVVTTREDDLVLQPVLDGAAGGMGDEGLDDWFAALEEAVEFMSIPPPTSTCRGTGTGGNARVNSSAAAVHYGFFSMNSGLVFSCAGDVAVLIKSFDRYSRTVPALTAFSRLLTTVFKLIPDVHCNKEAAANFGERLEDVVRVLGDASHGVFPHISLSDAHTVGVQISSLNDRLYETKDFLTSLSSPGWMRVAMAKSTRRKGISGAFKKKQSEQCLVREKFEELDMLLTTVSNRLVKQFGDASWVFKSKEYDMVVHVGVCIDALGGVLVIHNDPAKVRALARLIQADGAEVQRELQALLDSSEVRMHSVDGGVYKFFLRYCCCTQTVSSSDSRYRHARGKAGMGETLLQSAEGTEKDAQQTTGDSVPDGTSTTEEYAQRRSSEGVLLTMLPPPMRNDYDD